MPRVNASNGVRPEIRALAVLQLGKTVTPAEIDAHVGTGEYAAKYVSFLNTRYGFTITANKDGRKVVSYTVIAEPANAADLRSQQPKAPKAKVAKAPKVAKSAVAKENAAIVRAVTKAENAAEVKAPKVVSAAKAAEIAGKATSIAVVDGDKARWVEKIAEEEYIKSKNLETIKKVGEKFAAAKKKKAKRAAKIRDFDDVTEQFGTSGEIATSYSIDKDWDSIEGTDLSKLL